MRNYIKAWKKKNSMVLGSVTVRSALYIKKNIKKIVIVMMERYFEELFELSMCRKTTSAFFGGVIIIKNN